jgi:hypothetical protein
MEQLRALEVRLGLPETDLPLSPSAAELEQHDSEEEKLLDEQDEAPDTDVLSQADEAENPAEKVTDVVSAVTVQVEAADLFGANETRLKCERLRSRCQRLRSSAGHLGVAAPLRKRRYK